MENKQEKLVKLEDIKRATESMSEKEYLEWHISTLENQHKQLREIIEEKRRKLDELNKSEV